MYTCMHNVPLRMAWQRETEGNVYILYIYIYTHTRIHTHTHIHRERRVASFRSFCETRRAVSLDRDFCICLLHSLAAAPEPTHAAYTSRRRLPHPSLALPLGFASRFGKGCRKYIYNI